MYLNLLGDLILGFEDLVKAHQKALPVIQKEEKGLTPSFYLRILAQLEMYVNQQWENKKNMSKINSKSLATLRQKLRKYNKDFEEELTKFRDNPELLEEDDDDEEKEADEEDDDSESEPEVKEKKPSKKEDAKKAPKVILCMSMLSSRNAKKNLQYLYFN